MSIDRCHDCGDMVDTDAQPEAYVEIGNMRRLNQTVCLCSNCRDRREDGPDEPIEREFSADQLAVIEAHEAEHDGEIDF